MPTHTVYQSGADRTAVYVGMDFPSPKKGEAPKFVVPVLSGVTLVPAVGDRLRDDAGRWWEVTEVHKPREDGAVPVTCMPVKGT